MIASLTHKRLAVLMFSPLLAWLLPLIAAASKAAGGPIVWIAFAALVVSIFTFILSQRDSKKRARVDYVDELEQRIADCERDRSALHTEVAQLRRSVQTYRDENIDLMRRLVHLERP